jgi:hypothetical protein
MVCPQYSISSMVFICKVKIPCSKLKAIFDSHGKRLKLATMLQRTEELVAWGKLARAVENAYLHRWVKQMQEELNETLRPFILPEIVHFDVQRANRRSG